MQVNDPATGAARPVRTPPRSSSARSSLGVAVAAVILMGTVLASCSGSSPGQGEPATSASNSPSTQPAPSAAIKVGVIATRTGVGAGDFATFIPGMQAYFDMVDKQGGIDGRKLVLADNLDDGGDPTTFSQLAHTLIEQDGDFAAFISTFWFTPNLFAETRIPTYGYNVSGN
jgi:ABC-type branched-subunit amino acid transport system substrate-binding protein